MKKQTERKPFATMPFNENIVTQTANFFNPPQRSKIYFFRHFLKIFFTRRFPLRLDKTAAVNYNEVTR